MSKRLLDAEMILKRAAPVEVSAMVEATGGSRKT
jgi:hypothetical protein